MSDRSRTELYPLNNLPEHVSVSSSVLEIDRTRLDKKLEETLGPELTHLLIGDVSDKDNYGAQVSLEEDTSWVYIEETWDEGGLEFYRDASTGLSSKDTGVSIVVKSPKNSEGNTSSRMVVEVRLDEDGDVRHVRAGGELDIENGNEIPFINLLMGIKGLSRFAHEAQSRFNRGKVEAFKYKSDFKHGEPVKPEIRATNVERAGNGYQLKRLELIDGDLKYGKTLTKNLIFASVDTVSLRPHSPPPETKLL